jgi:hypothetical protein
MVANGLAERYNDNPEVGVACIYLRIDSPDLRTLDDIQRAILRQLCEKRPHLLTKIPDLSLCRGEEPNRRTDSQLSRATFGAINAYTRVFLLVDGIDEFGPGMSYIRALLTLLLTIQSKSKANLFLTSLSTSEIMEKLATWPKLEIRAVDEDITKYIHSKAMYLSPCMLENGHVRNEIVRGIINISDGM